MQIPIKKNHQFATIPTATTSGAAAYDLTAVDSHVIMPGAAKLVKTGLSVAIPEGCVGLVCSRSGLALKKSVFVLNAPGIIDSDYRGDVGVILQNLGTEMFLVAAGDRVAQLLFTSAISVRFDEVADLDETTRGAGGFGSTGVSS